MAEELFHGENYIRHELQLFNKTELKFASCFDFYQEKKKRKEIVEFIIHQSQLFGPFRQLSDK
jgi:hypothetical protein